MGIGTPKSPPAPPKSPSLPSIPNAGVPQVTLELPSVEQLPGPGGKRVEGGGWGSWGSPKLSHPKSAQIYPKSSSEIGPGYSS